MECAFFSHCMEMSHFLNVLFSCQETVKKKKKSKEKTILAPSPPDPHFFTPPLLL